jgi:hypothetical protein
MEWFSQNWIWVLFFVGMIAMHMFGHGGHGGHGSNQNESTSANKDDTQRPSEKESVHKH